MAKKSVYSMNGVRKSPPDVRRYRGVAKVSSNQLPEEFTLAKCKTKNQGVVQSCVAHALASCVEFFHKTESKEYEQMSTGFIYGNRRNSWYKGEGMYISKALDSLKHYGTTKASDFNNNDEVPKAINEFEENYDTFASQAYQNRITGYFRLYDNDSIKATLYQGNPVVFALTCREDMKIEDGKWIVNEKSKAIGGHCMYIYGWNKDGWKVANSWSVGWGNAGNIIIPYGTRIEDVYGLQDTFNSTKINESIKYYQDTLEKLRQEYLEIYSKYGPELPSDKQKKID